MSNGGFVQVTLIGGPMDLQRHSLEIDTFTQRPKPLLCFNYLRRKPSDAQSFTDDSIDSALQSFVKIIEYEIVGVPCANRYEYTYVGIWVEGTGY